MTITEAAIRYNRVTILALVTLILAGLGAFFGLPRAEDPSYVIKTALVTTYLPGASPQRVEELITDKIEKAVIQGGLFAMAMPRGSGKALALNTPLATPTGWTTMGNIRRGDEVFDENGLPCRVLQPGWRFFVLP